MGVCAAYGVTFSLRWSLTGSPVILRSPWWGHWLKAEEANASNNHDFSLGMFFSVCSKGIWCGLSGGVVLLGQLHSSGLDSVAAEILCGKSLSTMWRSFMAVWER